MKKVAALTLTLLILLTACDNDVKERESDYTGDVEYTEAEGIYNKYQNWRSIYTRIQSPEVITLPDGTTHDEYASYVEYILDGDTLTAVVGSPDNVFSSDSPLYTPNWDVPEIDFTNYTCTLEDGIYFCHTPSGDEVRMREDNGTLYLFYNGRQWQLTI